MEFEISAEQVKGLRKNGEQFTLLDVREPWDTKRRDWKAQSTFLWGIFRRGRNRNSTLRNMLLSCAITGVRSLTVTNWLRQQGFEKVQSMRGGIDGWARTVDPKVPLY